MIFHIRILAKRIFPDFSYSLLAHEFAQNEFSQNEFCHIRSKSTTVSDVFYAFLKLIYCTKSLLHQHKHLTNMPKFVLRKFAVPKFEREKSVEKFVCENHRAD